MPARGTAIKDMGCKIREYIRSIEERFSVVETPPRFVVMRGDGNAQIGWDAKY